MTMFICELVGADQSEAERQPVVACALLAGAVERLDSDAHCGGSQRGAVRIEPGRQHRAHMQARRDESR